MRGETVDDQYQKYLQLKQMEPEIDQMFRDGLIRPEKYESFKQTIKTCEEQLK